VARARLISRPPRAAERRAAPAIAGHPGLPGPARAPRRRWPVFPPTVRRWVPSQLRQVPPQGTAGGRGAWMPTKGRPPLIDAAPSGSSASLGRRCVPVQRPSSGC